MGGENSTLGNIWRSWRAGLLATAVALLGSSLAFPATASALGLEREGWSDKRITIELIDTPLRESLAKISELVGTPIKLSGLSGDGRRVSLSLQDASLKESLDRILASVDYVTIYTSQKSLAILVIERDSAAEFDPAREGRGAPSDPSPDQFSTADDLFPPPEMVKLAREESIVEPKELDPNDPIFFPPNGSESPDFTPAEPSMPESERDSRMRDSDDLPPSGEELRLLLENPNPIQPREMGLAQTQFDQRPFEFPPESSYRYSDPQGPDVERDFFDSLPPPDLLDSLIDKP